MKIREITLDDKEKWITLVRIADRRNKSWAEQKFDTYVLSKKKKRLLVIEYKKRLIGFAGIKGEDLEENVSPELNKDYLLITWIALIPEYRNKGLGTILLKKCEEYALNWKKKGVWLGCRDDVIPFYKNNEYNKSGTFINDKEKKENLMVKVFK